MIKLPHRTVRMLVLVLPLFIAGCFKPLRKNNDLLRATKRSSGQKIEKMSRCLLRQNSITTRKNKILLAEICYNYEKNIISKRILFKVYHFSIEKLLIFNKEISPFLFKYLELCVFSKETTIRYIATLIQEKILLTLNEKEYKQLIARFFIETESGANVYGPSKTYADMQVRFKIMSLLHAFVLNKSIPYRWKEDFKDILRSHSKMRFSILYRYFFPKTDEEE